MNGKPWWYPELTDAAWVAEKRADYPEATEGMDDESVRDKYADGCKYQDLWDHVGDAREQFEKLADNYLELRASAERVVAAMRGYPFYSAAIESLRSALTLEPSGGGDGSG